MQRLLEGQGCAPGPSVGKGMTISLHRSAADRNLPGANSNSHLITLGLILMEVRAAKSQICKNEPGGSYQVSLPLSSAIKKCSCTCTSFPVLLRHLLVILVRNVLLLPQSLFPCADFSALARSAILYPTALGSCRQGGTKRRLYFSVHSEQ